MLKGTHFIVHVQKCFAISTYEFDKCVKKQSIVLSVIKNINTITTLNVKTRQLHLTYQYISGRFEGVPCDRPTSLPIRTYL